MEGDRPPHHSMSNRCESEVPVCERPRLKRARLPQPEGPEQEAVSYLQAFLKTAGFLPRSAAINGIFNRPTEAALRSFQQANKLAKTGIVDHHTWQSIERYRQLFLTPVGTAEHPPQHPASKAIAPAAISPKESFPSVVQRHQEKVLLRRGAGFEISPQQQAVYYLQKLLQRGLFLPENAKLDGKFGRQTENGVKFFQVRRKLVADGIVGPSTWEALENFVHHQEAIAHRYITLQDPQNGAFQPQQHRYPRLRRGDGITTPQLQGPVRQLQTHLQKIDPSSPLTVDGQFGLLTEQMVKRFQALRGLTVDGIVGSQTWMTLLDHWVEVYPPLRPLVAHGDRLVQYLAQDSLQDAARQTVPILLETCQHCGIDEPAQVAYILATAYHEGAFGKTLFELYPSSHREGRHDLGNIQPGDGLRYQGRGFVKIVGRLNYTRWGDRLGVNLLDHPGFAAEPKLAAIILILGMRDGSFTGHKLDDYLKGDRQDFYQARRIVADLDSQAEAIAQSAVDFLKVFH